MENLAENISGNMENPSEKKSNDKKIFKIAALISYFIGFLYVEFYFNDKLLIGGKYNIGYIIFAALLVGGVELMANLLGVTYQDLKERKKSALEAIIFAVCVLLQSGSLVFCQYHAEITIHQQLMWHFTIIYYILVRAGSLAAGRSGLLLPLDIFSGTLCVPFANFGLYFYSVFGKERKTAARNPQQVVGMRYPQGQQMAYAQGSVYPQGQPACAQGAYQQGAYPNGMYSNQGQVMAYPGQRPANPKAERTVMIIGSVIVALAVCMIAYSQLAAASTTFVNAGNGFFNWLGRLLTMNFIEDFFEHVFPFMLWAVPVTLWLFGLVGGSLKKKEAFISAEEFEKETRSCHMLPAYSAYIIIGSICAMYLLFAISSFVDIYTNQGIFAATAHAACVNALDCFWALIRVVVLNFTIIAASCLFSKKALWEEKWTRVLTTALLLFGIAFAALAAWALCGIYVRVYGWTARRILSSWVVLIVVVWSILALVRLYKRIPAAQIAIIFAAVSFSALMCVAF